MSKDIESLPKSELRARAGLPEIDDRLKTAPRPFFRKLLIIGVIILGLMIAAILLFAR